MNTQTAQTAQTAQSATRPRSSASANVNTKADFAGLTMDEIVSGYETLADTRYDLTGAIVGTVVIDRYRVGGQDINVAKVYLGGNILDASKRHDPSGFFIAGFYQDTDSTVTVYNGGELYKGVPVSAKGETVKQINAILAKIGSKTIAGELERKRQAVAKKQAQTDDLMSTIFG